MSKHLAIGLAFAVMACKTSSILGLAAVSPAQAKIVSFYPACLTTKGDWIRTPISKRDCIHLGYQWITNPGSRLRMKVR